MWFTILAACLTMMNPPDVLYKVVTHTQWDANQELILPDSDHPFIHLSTKEQLERIISKFFPDQEVVILKLNVSDLKGHLVLERNPGGENAYYHLYDGAIPHTAIVDISKR